MVLLGAPDGRGLQPHNNSQSVVQVHDDRNILYVEYFKVFLQTLSGLYSVFQCGSHLLLEAATATTCFYKKKKNTDKCVHHHHVKQTLAVHKHTRYTTMTPPHCESPHSAVVLSAAGPAGCGSRSLGQCAGWTGPPDTVTGCRSGSHWNTGRKGTDPVLYSNYHVSQKRQ